METVNMKRCSVCVLLLWSTLRWRQHDSAPLISKLAADTTRASAVSKPILITSKVSSMLTAVVAQTLCLWAGDFSDPVFHSASSGRERWYVRREKPASPAKLSAYGVAPWVNMRCVGLSKMESCSAASVRSRRSHERQSSALPRSRLVFNFWYKILIPLVSAAPVFNQKQMGSLTHATKLLFWNRLSCSAQHYWNKSIYPAFIIQTFLSSKMQMTVWTGAFLL